MPAGGLVEPAKRDLGERLLTYAVRIVKVADALPKTSAGRHIGNQLLRSGTSAGANYEEAQGGESRADFIHKLQVALKECRESVYWLCLIEQAGLLPVQRLAGLIDEGKQLRAILSQSVITAKQKLDPKYRKV